MGYYEAFIRGSEDEKYGIGIFDDDYPIDKFGCLITVPRRSLQEYYNILRDNY